MAILPENSTEDKGDANDEKDDKEYGKENAGKNMKTSLEIPLVNIISKVSITFHPREYKLVFSLFISRYLALKI